MLNTIVPWNISSTTISVFDFPTAEVYNAQPSLEQMFLAFRSRETLASRRHAVSRNLLRTMDAGLNLSQVALLEVVDGDGQGDKQVNTRVADHCKARNGYIRKR